ncbi:MAG: HAMP domain-containing sensor histidine kinase, partial [Sneathiella sp.]
ALTRRNPEDLHPIEHRVPQEVQHLVDGINDLMTRLSDSMAAMRRFTSNAAHQLRTPLAAIQTQTELALKASSADELKQRLTYLDQSTRQSTRLVNQLLSLAKATPGENSVTFDQIDLVKECTDITKELVPSALSKGMDLGLDCTLNHLEVSGHAALIQEALKNLIENAISYGAQNSVVTVRILKSENSALIEVEDTGPGISLELQDAIFERFNRGNRSDGDGCGLGLPIVKEIVERHGWQISVSSQISHGAKFTISIPL